MQQESFLSRGATYEEPRLTLSLPGRLLVRTVRGATLALLAAGSLIGVMSDVPTLRGLGIFALLFFAERIWYRGYPDRTLATLAAAASPNLAPALTPAAYRVLERGYDAARITRQPFTVALLAQLLRDQTVSRALSRTEADVDALATAEQFADASEVDLQAQLAAVVAGAADAAVLLDQVGVTPLALLLGLIASGDENVARAATRARLEPEELAYAARATALEARKVRAVPRVVPHHIMNRAWTSRPTPALDSVSSDLTDLARVGALPLLVGHQEALATALAALAKPTHPHALLVAPTNGGKETVAGEVARQIVAGTAPAPLLDRRLVRVDVAAILAAGGSDPAALIKRVADEIVIAGNVILYMPDFHHLAQASGAYVAAADVLLPILTADTFPVLAATTPEAYARILETRGDVAGTFQVVRLGELTTDEVVRVLAGSARDVERVERVSISVSALRAAATLAAKYLAPARAVPGSALDLLAETAQAVRASGQSRVAASDVERVIGKQVHVPVGAAAPEEASVLMQLEDSLRARVFGQDEAVSAVAESVRAYRAGLTPGSAPPSFLFVGPTGVGKTELAKVLADVVYGKDAFTRLDMSEFSESGSVARLIGTTTDPGALTEPLRVSPHRLVLLDEVEKASPEALKLLLQVTSDGRLTDGMGRTVSFSDALVVATSNARADILREALRRGESVASLEGYVREKLADVFSPELLNRFTRVVIFRDLSPDHMKSIARETLRQIGDLVMEKYGITVTADDVALAEIVRRGYDPQYGARPLRRAAESALDGVLAPLLIAGSLERGKSVALTFQDGAFSLVH